MSSNQAQNAPSGNRADPRHANLKPWQPGQSGNPSGRPKKLVAATQKARERLDRAIARVSRILDNDRSSDRDAIMAATFIAKMANGELTRLSPEDFDEEDGRPVEEILDEVAQDVGCRVVKLDEYKAFQAFRNSK